MRENPTFESYQFRGALIRKTPKWYTSGSYPPDDAPRSALRVIALKGNPPVVIVEAPCFALRFKMTTPLGEERSKKGREWCVLIVVCGK